MGVAMSLVTLVTATLPARLNNPLPLLLLLPAPPPVVRLQAVSVSSHSSTRGWFIRLVPILEGSLSHGALPRWITGDGMMRNTGETVIPTLAPWSHAGDEMEIEIITIILIGI